MKFTKLKLTLIRSICAIFILSLLPTVTHAQDMAEEVKSMHLVLKEVYEDMLPLCTRLINVGRAIAGFGALFYIASRAWKQIAAAEPIDFYPMLRPFALGMAIVLFSHVIGVLNGVLEPTVSATEEMVTTSNESIKVLLAIKQELIKNTDNYKMFIGEDGNGSSKEWYKYTHTDPSATSEDGISNDVKFFLDKQDFNFKTTVKRWLSEVLEVVYSASSLCIDTLRTFYLIILAIIGPLVFGFAVYDGFQQSLTQWMARYINTFLWLPIANIFGRIINEIQKNMLSIDIKQIIHDGKTAFSYNDTAYIIFLIIGIVGYFSVPTIAGWIVQAHGGNGIMSRVNNILATTVSTGATIASAGGSRMAEGAGNILKAPFHLAQGYSGSNEGQGKTAMVGNALGWGGAYMKNKLSGNK